MRRREELLLRKCQELLPAGLTKISHQETLIGEQDVRYTFGDVQFIFTWWPTNAPPGYGYDIASYVKVRDDPHLGIIYTPQEIPCPVTLERHLEIVALIKSLP